jgi:putative nucleic acid modification protein with dual OB domain
MKILINHLTRMREGRICVAGVDPKGRHVRPVTSSTHKLTRMMLTDRGGPFEIGAVLDLGEVAAVPNAPATEDYRFSVTKTKRVKRLDGDEYFHLLDRVAHDDLESIFGPDLKRRKDTYAVDRGEGSASLGVLRVKRKVDLTTRYGRLRLKLNDGKATISLPVTDIRFVEENHETVRNDVVEEVRWRMKSGVEVILMVGLTRPFQVKDDDDERHWLQVNGICLADRPLGSRP